VPTILGEIKRHFRDRTWAVRVPRELVELSQRVDRAVPDLTVTLHRRPTIAEISDKVGVGDEEVLEALEASGAYRAISLEAPRGGDDHDGDTLGDTISIDDARLQRAEDRAPRAPDAARHPPRARGAAPALRRRPHPGRDRPAHRLSQMQVSRIIPQALRRLQATPDRHDRQKMAA
jgi:RNA polymerase sigma-B factor